MKSVIAVQITCVAEHTSPVQIPPDIRLQNTEGIETYWRWIEPLRCTINVGHAGLCDGRFVAIGVKYIDGTTETFVRMPLLALALEETGKRQTVGGAEAEYYIRLASFQRQAWKT